MSDNHEINELEKRIELLRSELEKTNLIGNKNLPSLAKIVFLFFFFVIMWCTRPDLVIKIIETFINSFGVAKVVGL
jgi:hypothetical protein